MSSHPEKYPGLYAATKTAGVQYVSAYLLVVKKGMSVTDAVARVVANTKARLARRAAAMLAAREKADKRAAVNAKKLLAAEAAVLRQRKPGRPPKIERNDPGVVSKLYAWHRSGYVPAQRPTLKTKKRYRPRLSTSTAPLTIQAVVSRYCKHFIKTGEFNQDDLALLQAFAQSKREGRPEDARKKSAQDTKRVSTQHEARHDGGREAALRDDGGGVEQQPHDAPAG